MVSTRSGARTDPQDVPAIAPVAEISASFPQHGTRRSGSVSAPGSDDEGIMQNPQIIRPVRIGTPGVYHSIADLSVLDDDASDDG